MNDRKLTEKTFWENYWKSNYGKINNEVVEIKRSRENLNINSILDIFDKYLPVNENFHVLEIGGAPGQYLIYMAKNFKYNVYSLDYSKVGNEYTFKNMAKARIPVKVYEQDLFSENFSGSIPYFDMVYSLGFVEHFNDLDVVVKMHTKFLKSNGILMLGVPNLAGIYQYFLKITAPHLLSIHNTDSMNIKRWDRFEKELNLTPIFKGYIGGFEPRNMNKVEKNDPTVRFLHFIVKKMVWVFSPRFNFLRKWNGRYWSSYMIGIYKKNH